MKGTSGERPTGMVPTEEHCCRGEGCGLRFEGCPLTRKRRNTHQPHAEQVMVTRHTRQWSRTTSTASESASALLAPEHTQS